MEPKKLERLKPKGPTPLPVEKPKQRLRTVPYVPNPNPNWQEKTLFQSRTILTIIVTILSFVLTKILGLDINLGDYINVADGVQLGELILSAGALITGYFRVKATGPIVKG